MAASRLRSGPRVSAPVWVLLLIGGLGLVYDRAALGGVPPASGTLAYWIFLIPLVALMGALGVVLIGWFSSLARPR